MAEVTSPGRPHPDGALELLGIPFARAARFEAPEDLHVPLGDLALDAWGPASPQPPGDLFMAVELPQSEDCLSLNVWTPGLDGRRPVMVWIHGGGFRQGGGSHMLSWGGRLAARGDVVVVTLNYRLGALGFLCHPDLPTPNLGLHDQIAALRWVRDHIAELGGDPTRVTVFGESAGAVSVSLLLASPAARGLFHRAAIQSSAALTSTPDGAAALAEELAAAAGASGVADLRAVPTGALLSAQQEVEARHGGMAFTPVIDGRLLPEAPVDALRHGAAGGVPTIVGTNLDEWRLMAFGDPRRADLGHDDAVRRVARSLRCEEDTAGDLLREVAALRGERGAGCSPFDLWCAVETERMFRVPTIDIADALHAGGSPTSTYLFDWPSPAADGALLACHVLDVPFVFGWPGREDIAWFTGAGPEADHLSEQMMRAWVGLAGSGDPSTAELPWQTHDPHQRPTMVFGAGSAIQVAPWEDQRRAVAAVMSRR